MACWACCWGSGVSAPYRVRQFVRAVAAWARPPDAAQVASILPPAALDLFAQMPPNDRRHGLAVMAALQATGHDDPDLLAAALLHDVGKAGALRLWHRVAVVLLRAAWPPLLERLAQDDAPGWRYAFYVQRHHAQQGRQLALVAGCSPRTAELIARHEAPPGAFPGDSLLAALQQADSAN
jgi:hypothetical protein